MRANVCKREGKLAEKALTGQIYTCFLARKAQKYVRQEMTELRKLIGAHWVLYKQKIEILKRQADEDSIPKYSDNIEKFRFKNKAYIYI